LIRVLWLFVALFATAPAWAQVPTTVSPAPAANPSAEDTRALIATLEDEAARAKLVAQLKQLLAAQKAAEGGGVEETSAAGRFLTDLSDRVERMSLRLVEGAGVVVDLPRISAWIENQTSDPQSRARWFAIAWRVLAVLAVGAAAELLARGALTHARRTVEARSTISIGMRLLYLAAWAVLELAPLAAFAAAAYAVLPWLEPPRIARLVTLALVNAVVLARMATTAARLLLMPRAGGLRILLLDDRDAAYLYIWVRRLVFTAIYGWALAETALLLHMPLAGHEALIKIVGLLVTALLAVLVLQTRHSVGAWIRGSEPAFGAGGVRGWRALRTRIGDIWHVLALVYIIALYAVWALDVHGGFRFVGRGTLLTVVILVAARIAAGALRKGLGGLFSISDELKQRYPGIELRANRYLAVLQSTAVVLVYAVAVLAILAAWDLYSMTWLAGEFGQRALGRAILIVAVLLAAVVAWEVVNAQIERRLSSGSVVGARARTLLPLGRSVAAIVIATFTIFTVLSEIGLDIGPLLAGAGVVGLALGIGSQTLVKDIVTGVFILLENQVAVGDVVKAGDQSGQVEAITIRTIQLRDFDGTLRIVPFSAVTTIANMTKDYSRYVFDIAVSYAEDVDRVIEVLKEVGAELQEDPNFGDRILGPVETFGIDRFDDSAVIVRARITTKPIAQWDVGREFNTRLKKKFDARGISMPYPQRTIHFGAGEDSRAPFTRVTGERGGAPDAGTR
jgi:small conductance mechanosensitive channel